jgi:hypothetical protein
MGLEEEAELLVVEMNTAKKKQSSHPIRTWAWSFSAAIRKRYGTNIKTFFGKS